jgi:hypothetical protein
MELQSLPKHNICLRCLRSERRACSSCASKAAAEVVVEGRAPINKIHRGRTRNLDIPLIVCITNTSATDNVKVISSHFPQLKPAPQYSVSDTHTSHDMHLFAHLSLAGSPPSMLAPHLYTALHNMKQLQSDPPSDTIQTTQPHHDPSPHHTNPSTL